MASICRRPHRNLPDDKSESILKGSQPTVFRTHNFRIGQKVSQRKWQKYEGKRDLARRWELISYPQATFEEKTQFLESCEPGANIMK